MATAEAVRHGSANLHTVFTSECRNTQFDWFATGVYESFRNAGMQGSITRLLACSQEDLKEYGGLDLGPTFPASVMHFTREANFTEEYILFIDADMILVKPIDPVALGAKKGTVVSEYVGYMIGWYHIFHRDDLKRIAPLWLEFCGKVAAPEHLDRDKNITSPFSASRAYITIEFALTSWMQVRTHPELYWSMNGSIPKNIPTGDSYVKYGKAPWIAEMYGYSFGAAMAGVDHVITRGVVRYPSDADDFGASDVSGDGKYVNTSFNPYILHYGIDFNIGDYNWNKMPRFFGAPPEPRKASERAGALVVNTLNRAFCKFYRSRCLGKPAARATYQQCEKNPDFMHKTCRASCFVCTPDHSDHEVNIPDPTSPSFLGNASIAATHAKDARTKHPRDGHSASERAHSDQADQTTNCLS
ncbi:MAG: hypothetical protein SGPRY_004129, partial [Prymnesium sp.]